MSETTDTVAEVTLKLPAPMDVAGGFMSAIAARWPDSVVKTDGPGVSSGYMTILLKGEMVGDDSDELDEAGIDTTLLLEEFDGEKISTSMPEELGRVLIGAFRDILDDAEASNFLEITMTDPKTGEIYTVTLARPGGETPAALLAAARAEIDDLRAELSLLRAQERIEDIRSRYPKLDPDMLGIIMDEGVEIELGNLEGPEGNAFVVHGRIRAALSDLFEDDEVQLILAGLREMTYVEMLDMLREIFVWTDDVWSDDPRFGNNLS